MTSSPDLARQAPAGEFLPLHVRSGFVAADTAPAPAPRTFVAAPAGGGTPQAFNGMQLPTTGAAAEEAAKLRESAKTAGFAEGWAQGMRKAAEQAALDRAADRSAAEASQRAHDAQRAAVLRRLELAVLAAADDLRDRRDPEVASLADTVLELACDLAGAVLDREVSLMADPVLEAVRRALRPLAPSEPVTVRVHPADLSVLVGDGLKEDGAPADAGLVTYVSDSSLQPGDAIARQGDTEVDASLRASVSRALDALAGNEGFGRAE
ncbi:flagellar assembly protein FliH [Kineococcus xinjiangensis]|uniref:Flagellar assembly protein FliH n=1 Tax=Kineococcus xinjiangensis TaxID=512762 RepID=A0A2S6IJV8_9ACTN|nr:FliH/SctL family protein [Kineococcus xinjiangensis]PPK94513.1 flagellar assembly protein FliH [Kineococcus xinjiangensis]